MRNYLLLYSLLILGACQAQTGSQSGTQRKLVQPKDTVFRIKGVEVWVQRPVDSVSFRGTLLLLPGWDFDFRKWCDSTDVCSTALAKGFAVVCPQMMRSIYASRYFPETRSDLRIYPTLGWLDTALETLRSQHALFQRNNFVLGLSTGGRGVALICERKPGFFNAAAALSGDFDPTSLPNDRLTTLVYGPIHPFASRWKEIDNPTTGLKNMVTPIYLAHGAKDKVVPASQSQVFYDSIMSGYLNQIPFRWNSDSSKLHYTHSDTTQAFPTIVVKSDSHVLLHLDQEAGHNFNFWRSELPAVWTFFDRHCYGTF